MRLRRLSVTLVTSQGYSYASSGTQGSVNSYWDDEISRVMGGSQGTTYPGMLTFNLGKCQSRGPIDDWGPSISPDGSKMVFARRYAYGPPSLYLMDPVWGQMPFDSQELGPPATKLTDNAEDPAWTPSGARIAFTCNQNICTINPDGSGRTTVSDNPAPDGFPAWGRVQISSGSNPATVTPVPQIVPNDTPDQGGEVILPTNSNVLDAFAYALPIGGDGEFSVSGTTKGATREEGEPDHYTSNPADAGAWEGDHTVWYSWTPRTSGPATIDTCQANIDSILAVYTGSELNNLSRVADNNNDNCGGGWGSKVAFAASAGTTYRIVVGDAGGLREDTFTLKVSPPPDTQAPAVTSTTPAANATGVAPG